MKQVAQVAQVAQVSQVPAHLSPEFLISVQ